MNTSIKFLTLIIWGFILSVPAHASNSYLCEPIYGEEKFKSANQYTIVKKNADIVLKPIGSSDLDGWSYEIIYDFGKLGFRAIRKKQASDDFTSNITSISVGGTLYFMAFDTKAGIQVLVTYANAYKANDIGEMRLKCSHRS